MEDHTRGVLEAERARSVELVEELQRDLDRMVAASESSNADDEHDPEGATIAFERQQLVALRERTRSRLAELDHALARLDEGAYGTCERCGQAIGAERLAARPGATTCVRCAGRR